MHKGSDPEITKFQGQLFKNNGILEQALRPRSKLVLLHVFKVLLQKHKREFFFAPAVKKGF